MPSSFLPLRERHSHFPPLPKPTSSSPLRRLAPPTSSPNPNTPRAMDAVSARLHLLLLLGLVLAPSLAAAQSRAFGGAPPVYARYLLDAAAMPAVEQYDYIVVGGGTAGCPLAATLAGPGGGRVLLLERGGAPSEFPALATAGGFVRTLAMADPSPESDAPAQGFTSEDGVPNVRARVLGGGTAINAGFYSRAHPGWFSGHGEGAQVTNWDMRLVNASYEWIERQMTFQPGVHGWQAAVRAALLEANVTPWNGFTVDHVAGTKVGATTFDASGRRHSAADLLAFARPGRLRVAIRATVTRIITNPIDPAARPGRSPQPVAAAIGVVYQDRLLEQHHALLRPGGEVILSAGALGSPQLLLLSGIGPASDLSYLNIPVSADVPDVGKHIFDNPRNGISIIPSVPIDHSLIQVVGIPSASGTASYLEAASYIVPVAPTLSSSSPFIGSSTPLYVTVATIMEKVPGPLSEGSLWLASTNPLESPALRFNYLSRPEDLARCVLGVRRVAEVLESRAMDGFRSAVGSVNRRGPVRRDFRIVGTALPPDWRTNDRALANFCQQTVATLWHYHGGCVVGKVVDRDFRVIGVRALRVVDASTFSETPGTNPQATILMMGRYVGLKMIDERHSRRPVRS
ncbi:(R)-mandelonitrile lyase-like [Phragmites australis]|uniref:(R)-mandelonitrile lyase-like n=1 Tax=Phragmites australis TaxID=29695 RepID=UPI002D79B354|nr:(R)-mandelonitrile lyase-like [Phragmites australis]